MAIAGFEGAVFAGDCVAVDMQISEVIGYEVLRSSHHAVSILSRIDDCSALKLLQGLF